MFRRRVRSDEHDDTMRDDIYTMNKQPEKKAERAAMLKGRTITYLAKFEAGK